MTGTPKTEIGDYDEVKFGGFKWLRRDARGELSSLHTITSYICATSWNASLIFGWQDRHIIAILALLTSLLVLLTGVVADMLVAPTMAGSYCIYRLLLLNAA
jgi:hypothetical protein